MECNRFLEEKLAGSGGPDFREHLAGCEGCRRDLEEYEEVFRLYREASSERYPGAVPRLRRFNPVAWLPAAAAAAVLLGILVLTLFGGPADRPPSGSAEREPSAGFFRVYLAPWDREEARLNEEVGELWGRLASLERRR